jgi:hypothetical protein
MTVTPFGETSTITSAIVYIETFGGDGSANFTIRVSTTNGTQALTNNSFEFITVQS